MKIAMLVTQFPLPSETFVLSQITGLLDQGHEVDIYASSPGGKAEHLMSMQGYDLRSRTYYFDAGSFSLPKNKCARLQKAFGFVKQARVKGIETFLRSLNVARHGRAGASLSLFYKGAALMKNGPYDILHCHFGPNGQIGAALKDIGAFPGKLITTFHGYDVTKYIERNGRHVYDFLFSRGDLFTVVSEKMKRDLIALGCDKDKIVVHRMGVDLKQFTFCFREIKVEDTLRLLSIGRLVEKKGLEYAIQAVGKAARRFPQIQYKIIGDGELNNRLKEIVKKLKVEQNIQLLGWKSHHEVAQLMQDAHILLAPSVTAGDGDQEGVPVVIMEALARGLPVISTLHSGIPELVQDGQSGFLVPEKDVHALTDKLEYMIEHPELFDAMGRSGRAWIEKHYDITKLNGRLASVYERLQVQDSCSKRVA